MSFFSFLTAVLSSGTNGVNIPPDSAATSESLSNTTLKSSDSEDKVSWRRIGRTLKVPDFTIVFSEQSTCLAMWVRFHQ